MRIALVGPTHPYKGGVAQHTTVLARRLGAAGHVVDLVSWSAQYPAFLYPGEQRVPGEPEVEPWPRTTFPLAWYRPDSWWRTGVRLRGHDLVVPVLVAPVQGPPYAVLLTALRHAPGGGPRTLVLAHNVVPHERRTGDRTMVRAALKRAGAVLVHSGDQARSAREQGATDVSVTGLPPAFPPGRGTPGREPDPVVHRHLLFFGLVRPYKGVDVLLAALARVPDVRLTIAGEFWGGREEVAAAVRDLGLTGRVTVRPGYVDAADVPALFEGVDALVLPYRTATSSTNADVAFQHGVPVVATRAGALADRIRDGVDGLVCEPGDADGLAAAIRRLYDEPGLVLALRGQVRPPDHGTTWERYVADLLAAAGEPAETPSGAPGVDGHTGGGAWA